VPYPILVFSALLPWQFFSNALSECSNSLVGNANLIAKIYFPRLIIPVGAVVTSVLDFLISMLIMGGLFAWYGFVPDWRIVLLPGFFLLAALAALGAGLWLAAVMVKYRDFRIVVPFIIQFGLYISPVGFDSRIVPAEWRMIYSLNPMVGIIDGFRWCLLRGSVSLYWPGLLLSIVLIGLLLAGGLKYFRRTERTFADVI